MRWLAVAFCFLFCSQVVRAETYDVNAFSAPGGEALAIPVCVGGCGVYGYESGIFSFEPGDTIDFGALVLTPYIVSGRGSAAYVVPGVEFNFGPQQNFYPPFSVSLCMSSCGNDSLTPFVVDLIVTMPPDETQVSVSWGGYSTYIAPGVPEPATWAMLLIGFAGIGFAGYRRSYPALY
jgi:hypothetical protein